MNAETTFDLLPILLLAASLCFAVLRPPRISEALVAVPAALLLVAFGTESPQQALHEIGDLAPVVGFLAAILVLSEACAREGLFDAAGALLARKSRGRPGRLLTLVFAVAIGTTSVLSLDATVVLLTPVVIIAARNRQLDSRPGAYACGHLANSASLLFPVSNLTNLLVFKATGLSFVGFGLRMLIPTIISVGVEYAVFRAWFRTELREASTVDNSKTIPTPRFALAVVVLSLIGFALSSTVDLQPVWVATAGALVMTVKAFARREVKVLPVIGSAQLGFCAFVLALGVIVQTVAAHGLGNALSHLIPSGQSLVTLLVIALVAAALANIVNNIPAALLMLPVVGTSHPSRLLAVLIGVNIGPNLTYVGSLATLLWRRALNKADVKTGIGEFTILGFITVALSIVLCTTALWATT